MRYNGWEADKISHVDVPELKGMFVRIKTYCKDKTYKHVRLVFDNKTAISYVRNKAGIK